MVKLEQIPLFQDLSEEELHLIRACLKEKTFRTGDSLFAEGSPCDRIFIVQSGRVKVYRISPAGREQTLETLGPGDTCACNPGSLSWSCSSSAEALTDCKVWFFSREDYVRMVQSNLKVTKALNQVLAKRLQCFSNLIEEVSLKDTKKRLIKFLLDILKEHKNIPTKSSILFIPFTREEIAQRLGTSRETVARQLSSLQKQHLIALKPYQIIIKDKAGLEKLLR